MLPAPLLRIQFLLTFCCCFLQGFSQSKPPAKNLVFVDKQGVLRFTKDKSEASFFGVNYTVPFAYGYRSHKALHADLEKSIDADVYHLARLGLDAFRVHVWDVEITDSMGNLLQNDHLRLFDYLVAQLKKRNIKLLLTPIAFWGNGYPQKDERTNGFSSVYGKDGALVVEAAIRAQENYLQQFFNHINPYTKLSYKDDPDVIATEVNNEPHHSGTKEKTTQYINRMIAAIKSTGWTKPVFYNISESPSYADAVAASDAAGYSFQWYPTGLVAGRQQKGNFLSTGDNYYIPFLDTIAAFKNKTRVVYEFDAGDILQSNMYPAMARSFRTAGFQWATQFAYDPMATAYANTEYQTHYLNLAYTPAKAISLLIASRAFHLLPRLKKYGAYPADSVFGAFRVSYKNQLSEMNSEEEFYYSGSTDTEPVNPAALKHIAATGSSVVVKYDGYGAYFLDKLKTGVWRLEVMPDAFSIKDPFEKASPKKTVTTIQWNALSMKIDLPDLGKDFDIVPQNEGNNYSASSDAGSFIIHPGAYLLKTKNATADIPFDQQPQGSKEFFAPANIEPAPAIIHVALNEVTANKPFSIAAKLIGLDALKITVELRNSNNQWKIIGLQKTTPYEYIGEVPADMVMPGMISYRIIVQRAANDFITFPGAYTGNPYAWDYIAGESWQTFVAAIESPLMLFDAGADRNNSIIYNPDWRNNIISYVTADKPGQLVLKAAINKADPEKMMGLQSFFGEKVKGRLLELSTFSMLVIRARTNNATAAKIKIGLINTSGQAFTTSVTITSSWSDIQVPLNSLVKDSCLLLPRPYPGFQPRWFQSSDKSEFNINDVEKLELIWGKDVPESERGKSLVIEIASVMLKK